MMTEWALTDFHFLRPWWLLLLVPAWVMLKLWLHKTSREDGWQQSCDPELLAAMQIQTASKGTRWSLLYWPIVTLLILAMAGPAVRQVPVPVVKNQSALVIALDVSKSMLSDDLKPSRLQRAKFKIQDLLEDRQDGLSALVVYSGDAFVVTPLTDDTETITALLDVVDPGIMPTTGTNTVAALEKAEELLTQSGMNRGQVLLVTDDIDLFKTEKGITRLTDAGITTHVLAVGTAEGAPIPTAQGFLKDLRGQIVIPQVNYNELQQAARLGQGQFSVLTNNINEDTLYDTSAEQGEGAENEEDLGGTNFIDDGPWLALLVVPMLALLYRRGMLMVLCLGFMLHTQPSQAWTWNDLWLNQDQQAFRQLEQAPDKAYEQAENKALKAAAAYKKGDYKTASQMYPENSQQLSDHYNRGNALAQAGELEAALESYQQALNLDPEDADTLYNKQIVEQALQQQQEQQQQQQQQNDEQQNQEGESSDAEQQQSQQQDSEQEQQQQAEQDQQSSSSENDGEESEQAEQQQQQGQEGEEQPTEEIELTPEEMALDAEEKQAMEQWLRRIKDDPGGLMRRKFLYQYHKRNQDGESYDNQTTEDW